MTQPVLLQSYMDKLELPGGIQPWMTATPDKVLTKATKGKIRSFQASPIQARSGTSITGTEQPWPALRSTSEPRSDQATPDLQTPA